MPKAIVAGVGSYLPERIVDNAALEKMVTTSDEWIFARTGIKQRHIAAEQEYTSDMAAKAATDALKNASLTVKDIDLIIVATTTPDRIFPSTATIVQAKLGMQHGAAFDIQAVCSGFIYALSVANAFIRSGQAKAILVIGAEKMSSIVNWQDRNTCVLFGDGAGAMVLKAVDGAGTKRGIRSTHIHSDGRYEGILYVDGGVSGRQGNGKICMEGKEVFRHAVEKMEQCVRQALEANHLSIEDIAWLVPHQANIRIMESVAKKLAMDTRQVVITVAIHANTSAASIPLAMAEWAQRGHFKTNDLIMLEAVGGGLTWGSCVICW